MYKKQVVILAFLTLFTLTNALINGRVPKMSRLNGDEEKIKQSILDRGAALPAEMYYNARVDHFNGSNWDTYQMRYLINSQYYNASQGPILFYTGNEAGIWTFYNMSGFMVDTLAKKLGALVVFAEHRYYGKSWPFGTAADSMKPGNNTFLTVPQVLRDFVGLIRELKTDPTRPELANRAVIVGGGSYGGMLSAWMRMKYPNVVQGALASSAPVRWFNGTIDPNAWTKIASHVIEKQGGQMCYYQYKFGFYDLTSCVYD